MTQLTALHFIVPNRYEGFKSYPIPVRGLGGLWDCEMLRIPQCLDIRLTDGRKVVSPNAPAELYSQGTLFFCFWYSFLLQAA
jgi:hypothetical protein